MVHHRDLNSINLNTSVLTIGSFDGVHLGHQSIIAKLVAAAEKRKIPSVVITFYPHPAVLLRGRRPSFYISSPEAKAERLGALGVEHVITMNFDHALSCMKAIEFLKWIKDQLHFQALWVGENFALGNEREGDVGYLNANSEKLEYGLEVVPPVFVDGEIISSTRVREALRAGNVARVGSYLGTPFILRGVVVRGSGRGKQLGIPTANLSVWEELAYPGAGVYACIARINGEDNKAVVNIGVRPTFEEDLEKPLIEAHVLNYLGNLYDEELELVFIDRLRDERRFEGPEALLEQIQRDIERAKKVLSKTKLVASSE
jgi:riboflavin kinase/FMN adenylyltransferase